MEYEALGKSIPGIVLLKKERKQVLKSEEKKGRVDRTESSNGVGKEEQSELPLP